MWGPLTYISRPVAVVAYLILQVALTTLITDWAVQWMVDLQRGAAVRQDRYYRAAVPIQLQSAYQQELHHAFSGFFHQCRVRLDLHARCCWHSTRSNRLRTLGNLHFPLASKHFQLSSNQCCEATRELCSSLRNLSALRQGNSAGEMVRRQRRLLRRGTFCSCLLLTGDGDSRTCKRTEQSLKAKAVIRSLLFH